MIKKSLVLILIIATMLPSLLAESDALEAGRGRPEPPPEPPRVLPEPPPFAANQVLVSFQPGVTSPEIATFYAEHNLIEMKSVGRGPKDDSRLRLAQVRPPAEMGDSEGFLQKLHRDSKVDFAELNYILTSYEGPNDPDFNELWGLHNTGQGTGTADADIDAFQAWHDFTTGSSSVIVGIIDSGVDYNHPDLAANMWVNPGEIPGNGLDDDGNGYIDDVHGINTITGSGDPMDDLGHGTHVAGTIGAVGNNGIGVVGVSWDVRIVACKFLGAGGSGFTSDAVECFKYFNPHFPYG